MLDAIAVSFGVIGVLVLLWAALEAPAHLVRKRGDPRPDRDAGGDQLGSGHYAAAVVLGGLVGLLVVVWGVG